MSKVKGQSPRPHNAQVIILYFHLSCCGDHSFLIEELKGLDKLRLLSTWSNRKYSHKKGKKEKSQTMILRSWLCCWDNPLGSINFTLITFYNTRALASFPQTTVWAVRVTNCETAAIWPMRIMQQMWPTGSGQYIWKFTRSSWNTSLDSCFIATWTFLRSGYITFHLPLFPHTGTLQQQLQGPSRHLAPLY